MKNVKSWTPYADLVVKNGKIYTVALTIDEIKAGKYDFPILEGGSVAVKDRKIIAVCPRGRTAPTSDRTRKWWMWAAAP